MNAALLPAAGVSDYAGRHRGCSHGNKEIQGMGKRLYVGNIPFKATEENLRGLFAPVGEVTSVHLVTDKRTGKTKGFAFVEMASDEEARTAIEAVNGALFMERPLSVSEANTQQSRERRDLDAASDRKRTEERKRS
jgi:RNA recognition motif-containing protein